MVDLDVLFSYKTIKIVTIQDRRLGILHYLFKIGILIYIVVYTLIIKQRYLLSEAPFGTIRATVREPRGNWLPAEQYSYCAQNQSKTGNFLNYPCIYMLGYDMVYPPAPLNSIFISTRVKDATYEIPAGCPADSYTPRSSNCIPNKTSETNYYTAGVEDFTLFMEHAIYGRITNTKRSNSDLHGDLEHSKVEFNGVRSGDIITVRTLLEACKVTSLDELSGLANSSKSLRYDGLLIMMVITYSNNAQHPSKLKYTYDAHVLRGVDVVSMEPSVYGANGVTERNRHGISVQFLVTGSVGKFDFPTFLVTIVSALVLLNVATAVVDLLLIYVMPDKQLYKSHKFEMTEDFSDVRGARKNQV